MSQRRGSYRARIFPPYGLSLFLNCFSLVAFLAVIGIGIVGHSLPVTLVGIALSVMFTINCTVMLRIGRKGWASRIDRERGGPRKKGDH